MPRPSSIDRLEPEVRERIARLRDAGCTLDEILGALADLEGVAISRSALGRHVQGLDKMAISMRRSRDVANALSARLGEAEPSRHGQLNVELLHTMILDLFLKAQAGDEAGELSKGGKALIAGDPMAVSLMARALESLAKASKTDVEYRADVEAAMRAKLAAEAKENIGKVARAQGLSAETAAALMAGAFGVKS